MPHSPAIWVQPSMGTFERAASPFGTSSKEMFLDGDSIPGHRTNSCTMYPMHAYMEQAIVQFRRRRAVELQHGRVSMYACIGYIVQEFVRWPGMLSPSRNISFEDVPNGLAALSKVPIEGWTQIAGLCGIVEITNLSKVSDGKAPGDFEGWGAYGLLGGKPLDNKERRDKALLAEINNGRP